MTEPIRAVPIAVVVATTVAHPACTQLAARVRVGH